MVRDLVLPNGMVAQVDDEDYDAVAAHNWHARRRGHVFYVRRNVRRPDGAKTKQYLHRFVMGPGRAIDHVDGNGLNNQKSNLRFATDSQNQANRHHLPPTKSSRFRGVTYHRGINRWQASIKVRGQSIYLGCFESETDAAAAYDRAALTHFGEFARTNLGGAA